MLEKVKQLLRHYQFTAIAFAVAAVMCIYMFGCESTVRSPFNPDEFVTRAELQIELEMYLSKVDLAVLDLDKQDAVRAKIMEVGSVLAQGGTVNPAGAIMGIISILGAGAVVDNRKKDSIIKTLQNGQKTNG